MAVRGAGGSSSVPMDHSSVTPARTPSASRPPSPGSGPAGSVCDGEEEQDREERPAKRIVARCAQRRAEPKAVLVPPRATADEKAAARTEFRQIGRAHV